MLKCDDAFGWFDDFSGFTQSSFSRAEKKTFKDVCNEGVCLSPMCTCVATLIVMADV